MSDVLATFLHDTYLGEVTRDRRDKNRVALAWDSGYRPGAVTLTEGFGTLPGVAPDVTAVSNFFGGYAPEGNHRSALAKQRNIDKDDLFGLLREFGGSMAGALTFRPRTEPAVYSPSYAALDEQTLARRLRQAITNHDLGLQDDSRSMLPGFQPKLMLALFNSHWFEPHGRAPSTHILKPQLASRVDSIFNELYSHRLSRHMGLSPFSSEILTVGQTTFLAIERFDRHVLGTHVSVIHQEDVGQALGLDWRDTEAKFQDPRQPSRPGHPSAYAVAELLASVNSTSDAVVGWLKQMTFHVLIGNNDAHAKNIGLLHQPNLTSLTPLYDAVPNLYQDERINWNLAMSVAGTFDHRRISAERIIEEVQSWAVLPRASIEGLVRSTLEEFFDAVTTLSQPVGTTSGLAERLGWNVNRLLAGLEISEPKRH